MGCKKIFALFLYLSYFLIAQAQKNRYAYGVYTSLFNSNEVMYKRLIGSSTQFKENHLFSVGIESTKQLTQKLYILGAIEYANHQYIVSFSNPNPFAVPVPDKRGEITLLTVPAQLRLNFWNYFFVSGGILVDFELKNTLRAKSATEEDVLNNQAGIGSVFGIGLHYEFKNGITIFSGLHNEIHGIILFNNIGYKKQLVYLGLQMGIRYQF